MYKFKSLLCSGLMMLSLSLSMCHTEPARAMASKVYQPSAINSAASSQETAFCNVVANIFYVVANMRDKGKNPQEVYTAMMASELPDSMKKQSASVIKLVFTDLAGQSPKDIGLAAYAVCMDNTTGIRRSI